MESSRGQFPLSESHFPRCHALRVGAVMICFLAGCRCCASRESDVCYYRVKTTHHGQPAQTGRVFCFSVFPSERSFFSGRISKEMENQGENFHSWTSVVSAIIVNVFLGIFQQRRRWMKK